MYDRQKLAELKHSLEQWEENSVQKALKQLPERQKDFITTSSEPINRLYTPQDIAELDYPWRIPLHARRPSHPAPRQAVDDAHVRRLRDGRGDQRPLQVPAGTWPDRPFASPSTCRP
jgi:hypothetical protein